MRRGRLGGSVNAGAFDRHCYLALVVVSTWKLHRAETPSGAEAIVNQRQAIGKFGMRSLTVVGASLAAPGTGDIAI